MIINMITEQQQEAIDEIMDWFDFERVHDVMSYLNWEWRDNGVPSIQEMKQTARKLLKESLMEKTTVGTGGFYVEYGFDSEGENLKLSFVVTEYMCAY